MKNIRFALMALFIATLTISCDKNNFSKTILSITEVTESSISGTCTYTPKEKNDAGYLIFLCRTAEVTDETRRAMVECYGSYQTLHENQTFNFDFLASNRTYYIMAVSYCNKNGKVEIENITILDQKTLASNDNRVTTSTNGKKVTLTMATDDNGYMVELYDLLDDQNISYNLKITQKQPTTVNSIEGSNCYDNSKIVCTVDFKELKSANLTKTFYAYAPTENENEYKKYEIEVAMSRDIKNLNLGGELVVVIGSQKY